MAEDKGNKTEQPTSRRRQKSREKGDVPKSQEMNTVGVLMTALIVMYFISAHSYQQLTGIMSSTLIQLGDISPENGNLNAFLRGSLDSFVTLVLPLFVVLVGAALLVNVLQVGIIFATDKIMPKFSRINPITGISKIFSVKSLMELFKSVGKLSIIGACAYFTVKGDWDTILGLGHLEPSEICLIVLRLAFLIFIRTIWILAILAIIDVAYQRWQSEKDMKMSKEEVKEENKQTEGDPQVKARIRMVQREMAKRRMLTDVPNAEVIVTNPTHLAIALKYDAEKAEAPMVLAKGQNHMAEKIKAIAKEHNIPIIENKPLARGLYKIAEIGEMIPVEFYQAVADVLAYIYKIKGKVING
jgi:flagellar biosynthetic protein FlhB